MDRIGETHARHGNAKKCVLWVILGWVALRSLYVLSHMAAPNAPLLLPYPEVLAPQTSLRAMQPPPNDAITWDISGADHSLHKQGAFPVQYNEYNPLDAARLPLVHDFSGPASLALQRLPSPISAVSAWPMRMDRIATYQSLALQNTMLGQMTQLARIAPASGASSGMAGDRSRLLFAVDDTRTTDTQYVPMARPVQRFNVDGWALMRRNNDPAIVPSLAPAGQYGGSQAGLRVSYLLDQDMKIAAFARVSRPLRGSGGAEAALGLSIRPVQKIPVQVAIEKRVALEKGGRNAIAAFVAGGYGPQTLQSGVARGIEVETYGQAGVVGINSRDLFADGMARAAAPLDIGLPTKIAIGAAVWGGAQPGVSRVDIGPQLQMRGKSGDARYRLSLDWRERISGQAQPGSGVAITLTAGF